MPVLLKWISTPEQIKAKLNGTFGKANEALYEQVRISMGNLREYIVARHLRASKGYSPDQLHHVSGNLIESTQPHWGRSSAQIWGNVAVGREATKYGLIHEYGGSFVGHRKLKRPPHLITRKNGERVMTGSPYGMNFPERSFMRSSLREQRETIITALKTALSRSIK